MEICNKKRKHSTDSAMDEAGGSTSEPASANPGVADKVFCQVMEKIAKNVPAETILTLRPTCKSWHSDMLTQLKGKHKPIRLWTVHPGPVDDEALDQTSRSLVEYTELMRSSIKIPFSSYQFSDDINPGPETGADSKRIYDEFFSFCGPSIQTLHLTYIGVYNMGNVREIVFGLTPALEELHLQLEAPVGTRPSNEARHCHPIPKLKHLSLVGVGVGLNQPLVADLIPCAVGLQWLSLNLARERRRRDTMVPHNEIGLVALRDLSPAVGTLKSLILGGILTAGLEILIELAARSQNGLRLSRFSSKICFAEQQGTEIGRLLNSFLQTQADYLRGLEISLSGTIGLPARLPKILGLRHLALYADGFRQLPVEFETMAMATAFPRLTSFGCAYQEVDSEDEMNHREPLDIIEDISLLTHSGVTTLEINGSANMGDLDAPRSLARMAQVFPSVNRLKYIMKGYTVRQWWAPLWTTWPNLVSLEIEAHGDESVSPDKLFSGVPNCKAEELLAELRAKVGGSEIAVEAIRQVLDKYKSWCGPGIAELPRLQRMSLTLDLDAEEGEVLQLTDAGIYFGLALANPSLQHVTVKIVNDQREPMENAGRYMPVVAVSGEGLAFLKGVMGPFAEINI